MAEENKKPTKPIVPSTPTKIQESSKKIPKPIIKDIPTKKDD